MKTRLLVALVLLLPALLMAAPRQGDSTFQISGSGANDRDFDTGSFSLNAEVGHFQTDTLQLGLRQGFAYSWVDNGNVWNAATRAFAGWHFVGASPWVPHIGASLGYIYGDNVNNSFSAGLEAGLKFFVFENTFVGLSAEYQYLFEDTDELTDNFNDGAVFYNLGIGFHF